MRSVMGLINAFLPPFLVEFVLGVMQWVVIILNGTYFRSIQSISEINMAKEGRKSAVVFATGPSAKLLTPKMLKGYDVFTVSNAFLHPAIQSSKHAYHFIMPYHEPLILSEYIDWLIHMNNEISPDVPFVLNAKSYGLVTKSKVFKGRKVVYISTLRYVLWESLHKFFPQSSPQSAPIMMAHFAASIGYKEIVFVGCDHNILKNYGSEVINFYDSKYDKRGVGQTKNFWAAGILTHLRNQVRVFEQYYRLEKMLRKKGVKAFNSSSKSWLEAFPFKSLGE